MGFVMVVLSLLMLVPSGVSTFDRYRVQVAERRVQRYFDELESMGRELAGPGRED
jgi:Na+-transporting methylmalonyl-CoA/oxaloacetate decarboxylase gamma subunit